MQSIRTFTTTWPIAACRLQRDDLKRLYRIIHDRQLEHRDYVLNALVQQSNETSAEFQNRRTRVENAFTTTVNITGVNNQLVTGQTDDFLDSINIPGRILTVYYTTTAGLNAIGISEQNQYSRAILILDFSKPTLLDFGKFPTLPTPNASTFTIFSASEAWFTTLNSQLTELFKERKTSVDWLHRPGIYDLLLLLLGLPLALWVDYKISSSEIMNRLPTVLSGAFYVYAAILGLFLFRVLFSYSRWVFPKVELVSDSSPAFRHRTIWGAVMVAVAGGIILDAIKAL